MTKGQGQRSRSNFPQNWLNNKQLAIDFIISIITTFCDSFGRCSLVFHCNSSYLCLNHLNEIRQHQYILLTSLTQGHNHLGLWMCLICLYLNTKFKVCAWNSILDMTNQLILYYNGTYLFGKFDLDVWSLVKVIVMVTWVFEVVIMGRTLISSMKSVGEIASAIWPIV